MLDIAPGSILQRMYFKKRLKKIAKEKKTFMEIGAGKGYFSKLFLEKGFHGIGFDLNQQACEFNAKLNRSFVEKKFYEIRHEDFLNASNLSNVDIIFSCMVIEHLDDATLNKFFQKCKQLLNPGGIIISFVPSSMHYWGIEDEIAGHIKRYQYNNFSTLALQHNLNVNHIAGLTYPISNILFGLSNHLVKKHENNKKDLTLEQRTIYSGFRNIKYKTLFPSWTKLFLNEFVLYPAYLLQQIFKKNNNCMVIYCEMMAL